MFEASGNGTCRKVYTTGRLDTSPAKLKESVVSSTVYYIPTREWDAHLDHQGYWDPQCTVVTRRGTQCLHRIFSGQVYTFDDQNNAWISPADAEKLHAGICPFHLKLAGK